MVPYNKGFSLGELLVALGILSLPILFVIGLMTTHLVLQTKTEGVLEAGHVAEMVMEEWKARPYAEIRSRSGAGAILTQRTYGVKVYDCAFRVSPAQPVALNLGGDRPDYKFGKLRVFFHLRYFSAELLCK